MTVCPSDTQDEIEKIMSEIESLQEVMNDTAEAPTVESIAAAEPEPEAEPMAEFRASPSDAPMEETLGALEEEPAAAGGMLAGIGEPPAEVQEAPVRLAYERSAAEPPAPHSQTSPQSGGSLSMRLTGSMTLTLEYEYGGEQVTVGFADNMLQVQLSDGTEFKIPVRRESKLRRVA